MNGISDAFARHGVLSATTTPATIAVDPVSAVLDQPAYRRAKLGDWIRVSRIYDTEPGVYRVTVVDETRGAYRLAVDYPLRTNERWWVLNDAVEAIVENPIQFSDIETGDRVKVVKKPWFEAGTYEVVRADSAYSIEIKTPSGTWSAGPDWVVGHTKKEAAPVATSEPIWKSLIVGDLIEIAATGRDEFMEYTVQREGGIYEVAAVDWADSRLPILVKGGYWVQAGKILRKIGSEATPLDADTIRSIKAGDRVRVKGSRWVDDGDHEVLANDGTSIQPIKVRDVNRGSWWVDAEHIFAVISRRSDDLDDEAYLRAKIGDTVRVETDGGLDDGNYEVIEIDEGDNLRLRVDDHDGGQWVYNRHVKAIVANGSSDRDEDAYKRAKVGDTVRVGRGEDHPAGEYVVTQVDEDSTRFRLAVDYAGKNNRIWWVSNSIVEVIVPTIATAIRGNCLIHVDVPTIMSNRSGNRHEPVIVARRLQSVGEVQKFRELAWDGPSRFVHHHFQRIEGTDIQNWVETDAPLTGWMPNGTIDVINPIPGTELPDYGAMMKPILGGFVIHIAAPVLLRNRKEGRNDPVIAVRKAFTNWATDITFARRVEWNGPSRMVHRPSTPIPGTEGRGVSFIETDADVTVYLDNEEPLVLRMPQLRAAA